MKTLNLIHIHSKVIFWTLIGLIIALFVLYMVFVNATIRGVVARQALSTQVATLHATLATLESEYISSSHILSMELARSLGFEEVRDPIFISKKQSVSLNSEQ